MNLMENVKKNLKEAEEKSSTEKYWDATELVRDGFTALLKFDFGTDAHGNNYIITNDGSERDRFYADNDEYAVQVYNEWKDNNDNDFYNYAPGYDKIVESEDNYNIIEGIEHFIKEAFGEELASKLQDVAFDNGIVTFKIVDGDKVLTPKIDIQSEILNAIYDKAQIYGRAIINTLNKDTSLTESTTSNSIQKEAKDFVKSLRPYFSEDEIKNLPEFKAYTDAIKDPEDIWCHCPEEHEATYKPDSPYLGVNKHGWICKKCKKYTQIG
jgi:hypothetical protein